MTNVGTNNPLPVSSVAQRGTIQKTFVPAKILSGFTDPKHFELLAGEYLADVTPQEKSKILAEADASRKFVSQLPPFNLKSIIIRDIQDPYIDQIKKEPFFVENFGQLPCRFCYVDPSAVISLQAWIEPRSDKVPTSEKELLEFALPLSLTVPAEVSFIPPIGPIQILSSNPGMQGLEMAMDQSTGKVMLSAPRHLNFVQIVQFNGRYFLRNGHHRLADALLADIREFPALVVDAPTPDHVALPGVGTFNLGYVLSLARPPLVQDFHTKAAVTTKVRERRYGVIVNVDVKPINIGI